MAERPEGFISVAEFATQQSAQKTPIRAGLAAATRIVGRAFGLALEPAQALSPFVTPEITERTGMTAAEVVVPQDAIELLADLGLGIGGGIAAKAGLKGAKAVLTRVSGAAVGGETGGVLEGRPIGLGALLGGTGAVLGEAAGAGFEKIQKARQIAALRKISEMDARGVGHILEHAGPRTVALPGQPRPPLFPGFRTPEELAQFALREKSGLTVLRAEAQRADDLITTQIQNKLVRNPAEPTEFIPYSEAARNLSEMGSRAFPAAQRDPFKAVIRSAKREQRAAEKRLLTDLAQHDPTGEAVTLFQQRQEMFRQGRGWIEFLNGAFKRLQPGFVAFNTDSLQQTIAREGDKLRRRIGDRAFEAVEMAVTRGAGSFRRDVLSTGTQFGMFPSVPGIPGAFLPIRFGGTEFVGNPLALSPVSRALLDVGGITGTGRALPSLEGQMPELPIPKLRP